MKRFSIVGRLAVIVASVAGALLAISAGAGSAAMAGVLAPLGGAPHGRPGVPAPGSSDKHSLLPAQAHAISTGMSGWQIVLIAAGAALLWRRAGRHRLPDAGRPAANGRQRRLSHDHSAGAELTGPTRPQQAEQAAAPAIPTSCMPRNGTRWPVRCR